MEIALLWLGALLSLIVRWCVSRFPYSGQGKPPLYGDYEAQRHWMEITFHLPHNEWYTNSSRNDLQYWGLDYPPLTAYHSYLCGYISNFINASWVALGKSRGFESYHHKLFMRYSVAVVDILIFYSGVIFYFRTSKCKERIKSCAAAATLLYPGLILIDYGHFQYNCVSLGLLIWAVAALHVQQNILSAIAFCLALSYKQMELYHAIPFFCYFLGVCFQEKVFFRKLLRLSGIGTAVIVTFIICWIPFLLDSSVALSVLRRLFPFDRGLYEDKVANIWCCLSILVKLKELLAVSTLAQISLVVTMISVLPSSLNLLRYPSLNRFKLALVNSSLVFFLVSFQVHEKSILLAAIPVCLIFHEHPLSSLWFLLISVFSIYPLLFKDKLVIPLYATCVIYIGITFHAFIKDDIKRLERETKLPIKLLFCASVFGALMLSIAALTFPPPKGLPDLHTLLCCMYSCAHFILFTLYYHWLQIVKTEEPHRDVGRKKDSHVNRDPFKWSQ